MIPLSLQIEKYLTVRRGFGYDLSTSGRILRRFAEFAASEGVNHITVDLFLRWKKQFGSANNNTWAARLSVVRSFATWLQVIDPRTEVPPPDLMKYKASRTRPYIYSAEQIAEIIMEAARLPSAYGLRGWTYSTFFGLIAVAGLRISEAIWLDEKDVDLRDAVVLIKRGKNGKSRIVPITASAAERLRDYRTERNRILGASPAPFFLLDSGLRPTDCAARYNFALVCKTLGLRTQQRFYKHGRGPRIHDLRHTFAVRTMVEWYRRGVDPDREMFNLSTYLGHTNPENTYWYIEAVPELLQLACERAERSLAAGGTL